MQEKYRYFGTYCEVDGQRFDYLWQEAQFTPDEARTVVLGGGKFIHESDFEPLEVSDDERQTYQSRHGFPEPTPAVLQKLAAAEARWQQLHSQFSADKGQ